MIFNLPWELLSPAELPPRTVGPQGFLSALPDVLQKAAQSAFERADQAMIQEAEALRGALPQQFDLPAVAPNPAEALALLLGEVVSRASGGGSVVTPFLQGRNALIEEEVLRHRLNEQTRQAAARQSAQAFGIEAGAHLRRAQILGHQAQSLRSIFLDQRSERAKQTHQVQMEKLRQSGRMTAAQHRAILSRLEDVPGGLVQYINSQVELNQGTIPDALAQALSQLTPRESAISGQYPSGPAQQDTPTPEANDPLAVPKSARPELNLHYASVLIRRLDDQSKKSAAEAYARIAARAMQNAGTNESLGDLKALGAIYQRRIARLEADQKAGRLTNLHDLDIDQLRREHNRIRGLIEQLSPNRQSPFAPATPTLPPQLLGPIGPQNLNP